MVSTLVTVASNGYEATFLRSSQIVFAFAFHQPPLRASDVATIASTLRDNIGFGEMWNS
jgi:hypothetical protein